MWRSASKSAAATPRLATIVGQPERSRRILETALPFVQKQGVVNPLGSDHGRGQKQVELTVAIGVECGDGRTEAGAHAADHRSRAGEVGWLDPPLAFGEFDLQWLGGLEIQRQSPRSPRPARCEERG